MLTDLLLAAACGLVALTAAWFLRPGQVLCVSVLLGVLQVFVTRDLAVSLGAVWQLATWVTVLRARRELPRLPVVAAAYGALVLVSVVVLAWSPDRSAGLTLSVQLLGLGATTAIALIVVRTAPGALAIAYRILAALVVVAAVTIVLFRVSPGIENGYFLSPLFGFLNGHDTAANFFTTQRNNSLDVVKSGGIFFVNANAASLFTGAAAALLGARAFATRRLERWAFASAAVLSLAATAATGSKTAIYLACLACLILGLAVGLVWFRTPLRMRGIVGGAVALAVGVAMLLLPLVAGGFAVAPPLAAAAPGPLAEVATTQDTGLAAQSVDSANTRLKIWHIGLVLFERQPIGALGYGGWHEAYAPLAEPQGLNPFLPPHDWVIDIWSQTGLVGVAIALVLVGAVLVQAVRRLTASRKSAAIVVLLALVALGWVLVHGLGDNTGFYGGPRLIPIVALGVAAALGSGVAPRARRLLPGVATTSDGVSRVRRATPE